MTSRGFDVNGASDQFTFAYKSIQGDLTIIARLKTVPSVDPWAQAGLMIRDGVGTGSRHVFVFGTPGNGVVMRHRQNKQGSTSQRLSGAATTPVWLKLERRSSTFTASRSADGTSWTTIRSVTISMSSTPRVGFAVASHSTTSSLTATFDNVSINGQSWTPSSLVGEWHADEGTGTTLIDSSGNGRNGTISGATWVAGRVGQALNFTGAGVANLGDLDAPGAFTLTAWMQTRSLYAGTCGSLVMKALDYGFELCGGQLGAKVGSGGAWSARLLHTFTSADLNTWKHVAMTFDGTTLRFYVGGVLIGSAPGVHTTTNTPLLFGRWSPAAEYWNGLIDEVRLYSRVLSQAEVQTEMGGPVPPPNQPPTVSLTSPTSGSSFASPATVALAATAADADGTIAKVDFYSGATLLFSDTTSPYAFNWTGVATGTYGVKAIATDDKGASTTSATANITVGTNNPPTVSMTAPAHQASFLPLTSITLAATASDTDGTIQKVEFYLGTILLATDTTSPYSTTWLTVLGSHSVSAVATDDKGARTVSAWRDFIVTASPVLGTAIFKPTSPDDAVDYYVFEIFAAGANPNTAAPLATQNIGLPPVVAGECSADVRATIVGLATGNYIATVKSVGSEGTLRSNVFAFTR